MSRSWLLLLLSLMWAIAYRWALEHTYVHGAYPNFYGMLTFICASMSGYALRAAID